MILGKRSLFVFALSAAGLLFWQAQLEVRPAKGERVHLATTKLAPAVQVDKKIEDAAAVVPQGSKDEAGGALVSRHLAGENEAQASSASEFLPLPQNLKSDDQRRWLILREVLLSKNDNDPRLDSELRGLSPELKAELRKGYHDLATEKLNERGTLAFLVGREASNSAELSFLKSVLDEPPCLSLTDCKKSAPVSADEDSGLGQNVSLIYPQLVSLQMLGRTLSEDSSSPELKAKARQLLVQATKSPIAPIAQMAQNILRSVK